MVQAGEKIGNHQICADAQGAVATLGSGAGGTTVRAVHVHLQTAAAIKFLRRRSSHPTLEAAAFLTEARAAAGLSHPHIARIHDFGEDAGRLYYVMDLCEGGSLAEHFLRHGPLPPGVALQWLREAASALTHAHRKGLLHRDIKPSNLLISHDHDHDSASLKLIDFGLAARSDDEASAENRVIGTPLYAAPEQLRGEACPASDVFSLGATFLHLLTGRLLAEGDVKAVIAERLSSTGYGHLLHALDPAWRTLLEAMLEIDPALRPADGGVVQSAIEELFAHQQTRPVPWTGGDEGAFAVPAADPEAAWGERLEGTWQDFWRPLETFQPWGGGYRAVAARVDAPEAGWELALYESSDETLLTSLILQGGRLQLHAAALGLGHVLLQRGTGWHALAWPRGEGGDAISWIRAHPEPSVELVLGMLRPLAAGLDGLAADGLENLELHPAMLRISGTTDPVVSIEPPLPVSASKGAVESTMTMGGVAAASLPARLAACIFHFLGGRPVPPAAFMSVRAYAALPRLSEKANRFLSQAIAGQVGVTCSDIVQRLGSDERLPGSSLRSSVSLHPGSSSVFSSRTASGSHSHAASTTVHPPPPEVRAAAVMPPLPSADAAPPLPPPPALSAAALSAPPPVTVSSSAAASVPAKSSRPLGLAVAAVVLVAAIAGGGGWYFLGRPRPLPLPGSTPSASQSTDPSPTPVPTTSPGDAPPPASAQNAALIRVPGDAATLAEAVNRCQEGGTIEIKGGVYREALLITRPLKIRASGGAALEDEGKRISLLTVKGGIEVSVHGLTFRNVDQQGVGDPNANSPLIIAATGARLELDQCILDGGQGDGLSLADKSTGTLSGCRISKNRAFGVRVSGGASATITSGVIQENGAGGVWISNAGSKVSISGGTAITRNAHNGVQVLAGSTADLQGVEISSNRQNGILAKDAGTTVTLGQGCVISDNDTNGLIAGLGASASVTGSRFERNKADGIDTEGATSLNISGSVFDGNGRGGLFFNQGGKAECRVASSEFSRHADFGIVFDGGVVDVRDCKFDGNGMAIHAGSGTQGEIRDNTITPGPLEKVVNFEEGSSITATNNVCE
ncbi:protein kinase [Luteolibacter arcticus]|uniref:Protein kinase n=1 Tax=Luteolibacter arcticus TaxID=1581411 RepID=A0ABT3GGF0_9BACT|nr:right-handed parallel beta-helix repeat-containing protein [Luteolibacter arcticus]MCW1922513.1 protein kinase [Luteolibacter arcticus]